VKNLEDQLKEESIVSKRRLIEIKNLTEIHK